MPKCKRCGAERAVQTGLFGLGPELCLPCLDEVQQVAERQREMERVR